MTVSIVTYHTSLHEMQACLDSLACSHVSTIWVIDNSSQENMREFCRKYPKVIYLSNENTGFGAAHNLALRRTADKYHLVLNSDVRFNPVVLSKLIKHMDSHPEIGIIQPKVTYPDGSLQPTSRLLPSPLDVFGRRFLPKSWISRRNASYTLQDAPSDVDIFCPYLQGSFLLMRVNALQKIGYFDERFFMYPEDIDICRRMWSVAHVVRHHAETIIHDHRAGSYHNWRLLRIHCVNMIRYFNKWGWFSDSCRKEINSRCLSQIFGKR